MKDGFDLGQLIIAEARKVGVSPFKAVKVFHQAYETHKAFNGSFKHHPEREKMMDERYDWMLQSAREYIESVKEER